jgi:hypothetical protein
MGLSVAAGGCDDETNLPLAPTGATTTGSAGSGGTGGFEPQGGTNGTGTPTAVGGGNTGGGSSGGNTGTGGAAGAAGAGGAGGQLPNTPGTITLAVSNRSGDNGKRLIASVLTQTGTTPLGGVCETIGGGDASGVVSSFTGVDSCSLGSAVTFNPDTYSVFAGIYPSGSSTPELCASRSVVVAGDISVQLTNFTACN